MPCTETTPTGDIKQCNSNALNAVKGPFANFAAARCCCETVSRRLHSHTSCICTATDVLSHRGQPCPANHHDTETRLSGCTSTRDQPYRKHGSRPCTSCIARFLDELSLDTISPALLFVGCCCEVHTRVN